MIQLIFILLHTTALLRVFNLTKVYCPEIVSPLMMFLLLLNVITLGQIGAGRGRYSFQEKVCQEIFLVYRFIANLNRIAVPSGSAFVIKNKRETF